LPIIALVQSVCSHHSTNTQIKTATDYCLLQAGVFLPEQFKIFSAGAEIFRELCRRTQQGQQSCAIVFGSSTAGGAYHPALSDYSIFVKDQAQVFLGGPPLVKMATGEIVDAEVLGGAETHAKLTGLADQIAVDE
jgi:acetyl-CoA carboxylase carboxyltransferase component